MYIENVVIGKPLIDPSTMFAIDETDWFFNEEGKTYFTNERFLPRILVDIGVYPSVSEIRRNRPDLVRALNELDFIEKLKVGKKRWVWILVGE